MSHEADEDILRVNGTMSILNKNSGTIVDPDPNYTSLFFDTDNNKLCINNSITGTQSISTNISWLISDTKLTAINGGTFSKDIWTQRDLNTIDLDSGDDVTLLNNQLILKPGKYEIDIRAPVYHVKSHRCRLFNVTDNLALHYGTVGRSDSNTMDYSVLYKIFEVLTTPKTFKIEHYCLSDENDIGFGYASGIGPNEIYTVVKIIKL